MATPRIPKEPKRPDDLAIPDAELVAGPVTDSLPELEPMATTAAPEPAETAPSRPEPAMRPPEPPRTPEPPRQTSALPLVIGGIVAAVIGFGLSQVVPKGWPIGADTGLDATVAAQTAEIARLSAALGALPPPTPAADLSPLETRLAALTDRLATVEASVAAIPPVIDHGPRLADLETRIAKLEALPPGTVIEGGNGADPAAMATLAQEIATLKSDLAAQAGAADAAIAGVTAAADAARAALADAQTQAATLSAQAQATAAAAEARAALGRIEAAVETGAPFATAVQALTSAGTDVPEPLTTAAATGLPTLSALQATFPDAARLALEESLRAGMGDGTMDRLGAFLRTQTGARSLTPREGTDPDAILSRAEAALGAGDLTTALSEVATLPPAGQTALATWTAAAQARVAAMAALATLAAALEG